MRRFPTIVILVAALTLIALPALAQDATGSGEGDQLHDAIVTLAWMGSLSLVLKKVVERLISWFSFLKGDLITLAAILVGWGTAYVFALDPSTAIAEAVGKPLINVPGGNITLYLISGVLLAFAAGYLADREELKYGAVAGSQNVALHGNASHTGE